MIRCVPKTYGFAHVCEECGAIGPIVGEFTMLRDEAEAESFGLRCTGRTEACLAASQGWLTGAGRDLCPVCRVGAPTRERDGTTTRGGDHG